jgi:hypothetical protein
LVIQRSYSLKKWAVVAVGGGEGLACALALARFPTLTSSAHKGVTMERGESGQMVRQLLLGQLGNTAIYPWAGRGGEGWVSFPQQAWPDHHQPQERGRQGGMGWAVVELMTAVQYCTAKLLPPLPLERGEAGSGVGGRVWAPLWRGEHLNWSGEHLRYCITVQ